MLDGRKIKAYMRDNYRDHVGAGQELNLTGLGEDAAQKFDLYDEDDTILEEVWEWAYEVERWLVRRGLVAECVA